MNNFLIIFGILIVVALIVIMNVFAVKYIRRVVLVKK